MTLKFNLKADKFPAAQWVEHQTAPCCGRGQGSIPDAGKLVIFVFIYFIFLSISFSLLITSIFFVALDTHIIYHQIDYMSVLGMFSSSFALVVIFVLFFIFFYHFFHLADNKSLMSLYVDTQIRNHKICNWFLLQTYVKLRWCTRTKITFLIKEER